MENRNREYAAKVIAPQMQKQIEQDLRINKDAEDYQRRYWDGVEAADKKRREDWHRAMSENARNLDQKKQQMERVREADR